MIRNIFNRISKAILRRRYQKLFHRLFWFYARTSSSALEAGREAADAFLWITLYEWENWAKENLPETLPHQPNPKRQSIVPEKYRDWFYLRDLDLHAERLIACPHGVCDEMCDELIASNLLFKTREEAEAARTVMLRAYLKTSRT